MIVDLVEPEGGDVQGLLERASARRAVDGTRRAAGERLACSSASSQLMPSPLFCSALCSCADEPLHHLGVVGQPRGARELRRVDVGVAREELAQHLAELVLGVVRPSRVVRESSAMRSTLAAAPERAPAISPRLSLAALRP